MDTQILLLNKKDNVGVALRQLHAGVSYSINGSDRCLEICDEIPFGHKVALNDLPVGTPIYKYGEIIGEAAGFIKSGALVHTHNIKNIIS